MSYLMMDLMSTTLDETEKPMLCHPKVGGIILFSRNFETKQQLIELIADVRAVRSDLLIAVDHEGGRVQRFKEGFTHIPAMGDILPAVNGDMAVAANYARELGFVMATELLACDIDLSFAPVLDLNGVSEVIGRRSFSAEPQQVTELANAFIEGMNQAGMAAVGKHFPGHGSVQADSHIAQPIDHRSFAEIEQLDMQPFKQLMAQNKLQGVMPAHVIYDAVDPNPAGFSHFWLQDVLRQSLQFNGVIFSDDLGMKGAAHAGDYCQRVQAALAAGCDMILLCNDNEGLQQVLQHCQWPAAEPLHPASLLKPDMGVVLHALEQIERWQAGVKIAELIHVST
ncbi:beta-N-acetylhexosaminidase [Shewanella marina]|uniref:beta-N-acetylhexosaminidase n=1 Tax=Shewanella marina TaxID=487319 RepID=UPI000472780A|nr:beta-N-acetylhexosaminidase [Shewanella marina]